MSAKIEVLPKRKLSKVALPLSHDALLYKKITC